MTSKFNFILLSSNFNVDSSFIGTRINMKTFIPNDISFNSNKGFYNFKHNPYYRFLDNGQKNFGDDKFKNKIILSIQSANDEKNDHESRVPFTLLTQQNLCHNIKFIQKNNNFNEPRILFIKYNVTNNIINNNQYLFSETRLDELSKKNNTNQILKNGEHIDFSDSSTLVYYFNIYKPFVNSDYFKFKFSDFIDLSLMYDTTNNNSIYTLNYEVIDISLINNFASDNLINYDSHNFTTLFKLNNSGSETSLSSAMDISISPVSLSNESDFNDNILLYNKINNISKIYFSISNQQHDNDKLDKNLQNNYKNSFINFIVLKGYDYFSKEYGKIYLTQDFTYLNSRILDFSNNFYDNYYTSGLDNMIYLSLGNAITGITQKNLYTNMKLDFVQEQVVSTVKATIEYQAINKIYFSSYVNSINVDNSIKNRNYLLEENYDYNYTNILYNNIKESNLRNINLNLLDFYHNYNLDFSQNIYNHRFNTLGLLNNDISINKFHFNDPGYISTQNEFFIDTDDISYLNSDFFLNLNNKSFNSTSGNSFLYNQKISNNSLDYDFRFNYNSSFNLNIYLTLNYNYGSKLIELSFQDLNDYSDNLLLNFHKIILTSNFITNRGSDFKNVDCIFIYYDPEDENTPESFKYPFNNIEISNNPNIDTLSKAIVLLPGAESSITNTMFIPAKNGSNMSRKKIQGLIGLNDIPKLLSVEPYDENFINGRGFTSQYQIIEDQIQDECKSDNQRVEDKLNSQKHISVKNRLVNNLNNNRVSRKKNFANIVKNRRLNQNLSTAESCETNKPTIENYTTPFTNPIWKRTHR